ncbi:hypothetical protein COV17_01390 [Candidatus Woesearchaeota archaeon CG10_big_fil_rev_8_21_14_0_10_36_11]|nr:MAG: hypothetical protein COV17_01390 [Candidatus Woesearchaeota archaeon CG10_big_fil_rev_8_21_14_0_10_36_11]
MTFKINKKGAFFHWALLGIIGAIAVFFILSDSITLSQKIPGEWSFDFLYGAFYASETKLLEYDSTTRQTARDSAVALAEKGGFSTKTPCGIQNDIVLWHKGDEWCIPDASTNFVSLFHSAFVIAFGNDVHEITVKEKILSGKSDVLKLDTMPFHTNAPREYKHTYSREYAFTIDTGYDLAEYSTIYQEAQSLVTACGASPNLLSCLSQNMGLQWRDETCITKNYFPTLGTRILPFCVISPSVFDIKYKFALDFTPPNAFPVRDVSVSYDSSIDRYAVRFTKDNFAEKYTIYYSDATYLEGRSGKAVDIFTSSLADFGYFYESNEIQPNNLIINDDVCSDFVLGDDEKAYLCGDTILYFISDNRLTTDEGIAVAVTTIFDGEESDTLQVTKHLNS